MGFKDRLQHAWNAFKKEEKSYIINQEAGYASYTRPDRVRLSGGNEMSIVTSLYNQIGIDAASMSIKHIRVDQNGRYLETIMSGLNEALTVSANIDQSGRALLQDIVMSMIDEGCVAVIPIDTTIDPTKSSSYDITTLRTGSILDWFPTKVRVRTYNESTGKKEEIVVDKKYAAIIENPLYAVMNEPNSTLKRLVRKLNLLDAIDEQSGSGKLDLIIQLPYVIKSDKRREAAELRRQNIEEQLSGSKYGVAYVDGTEKVIQLNRPSENNLLSQIEFLTRMLYSQLGITQAVFEGSADEQTMLNYFNRTIEPILSAIINEFERKFLTKTARTQNQAIRFFRDPFKLVPTKDLADIVDKFTRNEILSSNEVRAFIGMKPSDDPNADILRNKNMPQVDPAVDQPPLKEAPPNEQV